MLDRGEINIIYAPGDNGGIFYAYQHPGKVSKREYHSREAVERALASGEHEWATKETENV